MEQFILDKDEVPWDSGVEDNEENVNQSQEGDVPVVILGKYVEELVSLGVVYHDAAEVISAGGMRDTIVFMREFFDVDNFVSFLSSLPLAVLEKFAGIVYSDEISDEDLIHEVFDLFNREVSTDSNFSFITYYGDLYYSNSDFQVFLKNMLVETRNSVKLNLGSLATEQEIKKYSDIVISHREKVKFLVNQILDRTDFQFNKEIILSLLEEHDKDLLYPQNLNFFSLDKGLFGGSYHKFSKHPAIDNFYNHKVSSFHHIECYLMNDINLEDQLEVYFNFIPILICDVYDMGMTIENFKTNVRNNFQLLHLGDEFNDKIENILNSITELPPS